SGQRWPDHRVQERGVSVPWRARPVGAAERILHGAGWIDNRRGGSHRQREERADGPHAAAVRSAAGRDSPRWRANPRHSAGRAASVLRGDALAARGTHAVAEIVHSLRAALAGRTSLIASHRISAIRDATWIIVLDEGRIVEQGRRPHLLAAGGRYWALLNRQ